MPDNVNRNSLAVRRQVYRSRKDEQRALLQAARSGREVEAEVEACRNLDELFVTTGWLRSMDPELRRLRRRDAA